MKHKKIFKIISIMLISILIIILMSKWVKAIDIKMTMTDYNLNLIEYVADNNIKISEQITNKEKYKTTIRISSVEKDKRASIPDYGDISTRPWNNTEYRKKGYNVEKVVIEEGINAIGANSFYGVSSIEEIDISQSTVRKIGTSAFSETGIKEITLPSNCKEIGQSAFSNCKNLTSVKLNEELEKIDAGAFQNCNSLKEIKIPSSVKEINGAIFWQTNLNHIFLEKGKDNTNIINQLTKQGYGDKIVEINNYIETGYLYSFEGKAINKKYILTEDMNTYFNTNVIVDEENAGMTKDEYMIYLINNKEKTYHVWETNAEGRMNYLGSTDKYTGFYNGKAYKNGEVIKNVTIALPKGTNISSDANIYAEYEILDEDKIEKIEELRKDKDAYIIDENGELGNNLLNTTEEIITGDVNLDGVVDLRDVVLLNKKIAGAVDFTERQLENADCYKDSEYGEIDGFDSITLIRFLVKLEKNIPVVEEDRVNKEDFVKKINDEYYNTYIKPQSGIYEFIDIAKMLHKQISKEANKNEGKMKYSDEDIKIEEIYKDKEFGEKINGNSYIGMCLYEYGIDTNNIELIKYISESQGKLKEITDEQLKKLGWQKIEYVNKDMLEEGDIILGEKENQIYVGDGVYACDNEDTIKNEGLTDEIEPGKNKYIIRIEPTSGKIGKNGEWKLNDGTIELNIDGEEEIDETNLPWKASINSINKYEIKNSDVKNDVGIKLVGAALDESTVQDTMTVKILGENLSKIVKQVKEFRSKNYEVEKYTLDNSTPPGYKCSFTITFKRICNSPIKIEEDYDVRASNNKNVIRRIEDFKKMFDGYGIISEHAQTFMDMQERYNVNAVFAGAVARIESSGGTNGNLVGKGDKNNNTTGYPYNMFSKTYFKCTLSNKIFEWDNGSNSNWIAYDSFDQSIMDFGNYIANYRNGDELGYYTLGKFKVSEIGKVYNDNGQWYKDVNDKMTEALQILNKLLYVKDWGR